VGRGDSAATVQIRAYFNPGGVITGTKVADMGAIFLAAPSEWEFFLQLTVRSLGAMGTGKIYCDANYTNALGTTKQANAGLLAEANLTSTGPNVLEVSLAVAGAARPFATIENCSIEYLPAPAGGSGDARSLLVPSTAQRCPNCSPDNPVPVALRMKFDSKIAAGTCANCEELNKPTVLIHPSGADFSCCWMSQPINYCKGGVPGLWMLEKTDPRTWTLSLRRGSDIAVTYSLTTKKEKDCTFPINLKFISGTDECKKWPKTVTIAPGP
jgi:hypothetical protein